LSVCSIDDMFIMTGDAQGIVTRKKERKKWFTFYFLLFFFKIVYERKQSKRLYSINVHDDNLGAVTFIDRFGKWMFVAFDSGVFNVYDINEVRNFVFVLIIVLPLFCFFLFIYLSISSFTFFLSFHRKTLHLSLHFASRLVCMPFLIHSTIDNYL
jgi:hypothetical protein